MNETEIQKVFSKSAGSRERKNIISLIRKKGNFLNQEIQKPVRKPDLPHSEIIPCVFCLGFYSRRQFRKHKKICTANPNSGDVKKLSDCQNVLIRHLKIDTQLKEKVFPRIKNDVLICAYSPRYIKIYRKNHFINVTSRKMRDLGRLLLEIKKMEPAIKNMFDYLVPKYFDVSIRNKISCKIQ